MKVGFESALKTHELLLHVRKEILAELSSDGQARESVRYE